MILNQLFPTIEAYNYDSITAKVGWEGCQLGPTPNLDHNFE